MAEGILILFGMLTTAAFLLGFALGARMLEDRG